MAAPLHDITSSESTDRLKGEVQNLLGAARDRALGSVQQRATETVGRLTDYVENGGGPGLAAAFTGAKDLAEGKSPARAVAGGGWSAVKDKVGGLLGGGKKKGGGQGKKLKVTNIVESIDVGVPVRVAYDQWTQFSDFPSFMKKVENVEQEEDEQLQWRAQILWSHRNWKSTILHQVPDEEIAWRSEGDKGYVDGVVTFHELAPRLTRILLVLEYNPKGFFEHTGNLWRAQGRRVRLELKHYRRHLTRQALLQPDELEGWRGVIEDGEVVKDQETALSEEEQHDDEPGEDEREPEQARDDYPADEVADEEDGEEGPAAPDDEYPEDEYGDEDTESGLDGEEPPADESGQDYAEPREREPVSRRRPSRGGNGARESRPARRRSAPARAR